MRAARLELMALRSRPVVLPGAGPGLSKRAALSNPSSATRACRHNEVCFPLYQPGWETVVIFMHATGVCEQPCLIAESVPCKQENGSLLMTDLVGLTEPAHEWTIQYGMRFPMGQAVRQARLEAT